MSSKTALTSKTAEQLWHCAGNLGVFGGQGKDTTCAEVLGWCAVSGRLEELPPQRLLNKLEVSEPFDWLSN